MPDRVYKTACDLAREKHDFALMHFLGAYDIECHLEIVQGTLVRALASYDDDASLALIPIFAAAITDSIVKSRIMFDRIGRTHVLQPPAKTSVTVFRDEDDLYRHRPDAVAKALMGMYANVPLLAPHEGRMIVSQDESESHIFHVGCLEKTKQAIFEILASRWAHSSSRVFPLEVIRFFRDLPFKKADPTMEDKGRSRDRELALNALRSHALIRGSALTQDIQTLIRDKEGSMFGGEDYWSDLLTMLAISRIKAMQPDLRILELKKVCKVD